MCAIECVDRVQQLLADAPPETARDASVAISLLAFYSAFGQAQACDRLRQQILTAAAPPSLKVFTKLIGVYSWDPDTVEQARRCLRTAGLQLDAVCSTTLIVSFCRGLRRRDAEEVCRPGPRPPPPLCCCARRCPGPQLWMSSSATENI